MLSKLSLAIIRTAISKSYKKSIFVEPRKMWRFFMNASMIHCAISCCIIVILCYLLSCAFELLFIFCNVSTVVFVMYM